MTRLSVVMAVHDAESDVRESIESVLNQSVSDFELLIVDDASTDGTPAVLDDYARRDSRVRVLRNPQNIGPYPSANRGFAEARGHLIARHDADDVSPADRFEVQLDAFASAPDVSLVTGAIERFHADGDAGRDIIEGPSWQPALEWELLFQNAIGAGAHAMFPRTIAGAPVLFPGRRRYAEDYELLCHLTRVGRVVSPPQIVYRYRQHEKSITARRRSEQDTFADAVRHENQAIYVSSPVSLERAVTVSRFWRCDGAGPLSDPIPDVIETFSDLRRGFLAYIERRYGDDARRTLDDTITRRFETCVAYWLYRSATFGDGKACSHLASLAAGRRAFRIGMATLKLGTGAVWRKIT